MSGTNISHRLAQHLKTIRHAAFTPRGDKAKNEGDRYNQIKSTEHEIADERFAPNITSLLMRWAEDMSKLIVDSGLGPEEL